MQEKTLIQITDEIRDMMFHRQSYIDNKIPVPVEVETRLNELMDFSGEKIDRCVSFMKMAEHQINWLDSEIEHLQKQKQKYTDSIERLKDIAKYAMESNGVLKMEGQKGHSFSLRKSESVEVTELSKLPASLVRQKVSIEPDKAAIKAVIKSGEKIEGAHIKENFSVVIK